MIVSRDIHPERDFYYLGAKVIRILEESKTKTIDFFETYSTLKKQENVSINLYVLTLDWLFLLRVIDKNENGDLIKCF
jgi:hypothetical protein